MRDIVKKYTFTKEEKQKLQDIQIGIVSAEASLDGLHIYKNVFLGEVYKRLGIDGDPKKGYSKSIQYNLGLGQIVHTQSPIKKGLAKK